MAWQWKDRKGFSHNFKSPVGKQRRPACPVCGYSEVPDRPGEWRWDSGDRLKATVWPSRGLSQTAGLGQVAWEQTPARQAGTAVAEVMGAGMHSPWKTKLSHWPGLKDNFSAEGEIQPSPSAWHGLWRRAGNSAAAVSGTSKLFISLEQAWEKPWRGAGWAQQVFLSFPLLPFCSRAPWPGVMEAWAEPN